MIGCKWVHKKTKQYKKKEGKAFNACVVAKGYSQRKEVDYYEIFFAVVRHTSISAVFAIVAYLDIRLEQMDVKTTFLNADLYGATKGVSLAWTGALDL